LKISNRFEKKMSKQENSFFDAANHGNLPRVKELVHSEISLVNRTHESGWTALHSAAHQSQLAIVEFLIKSGANVNSTISKGKREGCTPLHVASEQGNLNIVEKLLLFGADSTLTSKQKRTALDYAIRNKHRNIVKVLEKLKKNMNSLPSSSSSHSSPPISSSLPPTSLLPPPPFLFVNTSMKMFECPITRQIMKDPVTLEDGFTYEKNSILEWLSSNNISPMTNVPLKNKNYFPNHVLKNLILHFQNSFP